MEDMDFTREYDVMFIKTNGQYTVKRCKFNNERHMDNYISKMERERMWKYVTIDVVK